VIWRTKKKFDGQRLWDLNPLTQVVTALFVCLVPKLWRMLQVGDDYLDDMREHKDHVISLAHHPPSWIRAHLEICSSAEL
jgi:hypothetical protein